MLIALTAAVALMAGAPPTAEAPAGPTTSTVTVTPRAPDKIEVQKKTLVCENVPVLGSLFPKRVCATEEERTDRRAYDQAELRRATALRPCQIDRPPTY